MKKPFVKAIGSASLAIVMLAGFAHVWASAQGQSINDQGLVGSWNLQVTIRDCQTGMALVTFAGMETYNQGGTMQQTAIPGPGVNALPGHGVWSHQTGGRYSGAFQSFGLNPDPALIGRLIVRSAISLSRDGNSYTSTDTAEVLNLNGDLLDRACSTTLATRFE